METSTLMTTSRTGLPKQDQSEKEKFESSLAMAAGETAKDKGETTVEEQAPKKRQYKNGHKGHDKFKEAIKLARETYQQVKKATTLEEWRVALGSEEEDCAPITWREVWRHIVSLALKGLIEVAEKAIKGGFLKLKTVGHETVYEMKPGVNPA